MLTRDDRIDRQIRQLELEANAICREVVKTWNNMHRAAPDGSGLIKLGTVLMIDYVLSVFKPK